MDKTIWMSTRKAKIRPKIRQFLFKMIHEVFRIGDFWSHIQAITERQFCTTCGTMESMDHILIHCRCRPMRQILCLAREAWPHRNLPWLEINLGTILGCGSQSVQQVINNEAQNGNQEHRNNNAHHKGASCLLQILISESAFLIWVLRCKRVIQEKTHTRQETNSRWLSMINSRLTEDKNNSNNSQKKERVYQLSVKHLGTSLEKRRPPK